MRRFKDFLHVHGALPVMHNVGSRTPTLRDRNLRKATGTRVVGCRRLPLFALAGPFPQTAPVRDVGSTDLFGSDGGSVCKAELRSAVVTR